MTLPLRCFSSHQPWQALDNKEIPDELIDSCKRIINSKTVALAEQELNNQLESHGLNEVSFLPGYIANVYTGSLIWASSDTPSNHSPFSFAKVEPIRAAEQKNRHLALQLILTQSRDVSRRNQSFEQTGSPSSNEFPRATRAASDVHSCFHYPLW